MKEELRNVIGKVIVFSLAVSCIVFLYGWYSGSEQHAEGQLVEIQIFSRHDGLHDTVIVFNVSGSNQYIVINEWKTGQVIELNSHVGEKVRVDYVYRGWQDRNILTGYELI